MHGRYKVTTYFLETFNVTNRLASRHILIVGGIGQISVARLIGQLIVLVREPVLKPVTVEHFRLVSVLMHIQLKS